MIPTCGRCGVLHTTLTCPVVPDYRLHHEDTKAQADFEGEEPTGEARHFNREWSEAREEDANRIKALEQQVDALTKERDLWFQREREAWGQCLRQTLALRTENSELCAQVERLAKQLATRPRSERQVLVDIQDVD